MGFQIQFAPESATAPYSKEEFWETGIGIVTPHRAQRARIIRALVRVFPDHPSVLIRRAVNTVEKYQGQARDIILASFSLGDPDIIQDEDEFLLSLNRFNVMASRARAKLIVFVSEEVVQHLSDDLETLKQSRLLKTYVESFCNQLRPMTLGFIDEAGEEQQSNGAFKYRRAGVE